MITGRLGWLSPVAFVDVDYKRHGGVTRVPLYDAQEIALLEVVRPSVDWRAVRTARPGSRSPLAALDPAVPGQDRVLLAGVARIARVGRAAVVAWRRRHPDLPDPVAGTDVHPQFDCCAVVAWLLAHDKIGVPVGPTIASLVPAGSGGAVHRFRLDDPWLSLADDAAGEDSLSGWSTDDDADALAELAAGEFGASVRRLAAPGSGPLAVPGEIRVVERFRSGAGGLRVTLATDHEPLPSRRTFSLSRGFRFSGQRRSRTELPLQDRRRAPCHRPDEPAPTRPRPRAAALPHRPPARARCPRRGSSLPQ
ncbi:hypothetical protein [Streptomyces sp. NPDC048603]|uniref:hypothetical protein n=1 Tax=Streptomyces sp. NPDC048603 TaxID=3365577 RepID=UPI00371EA211